MNAPWGLLEIPEGEELTLQFGSLSVGVRREGSEITTRRELAGEVRGPAEPVLLAGDAEGWKRWIFSSPAPSLRFSPRLPERSILVAPRDQFHLMRGVEAVVFLSLPLWVGIEEGRTGEKLTDLPTRSLARTWFGSRSAGEICFWHRSRFFLKPPPLQEAAASVVCPLRIYNDSREDLPLEKIALRMRHFSLFRGEERYWTDAASIRFKGRDEGSELEFSGKAPPEAGAAELICRPHQAPGRVFWAKAFFNLLSNGSES